MIYQRYMRRVEVFRKMIEQPTVFFRCVRDQEEIEFINENWENINSLLKSFNDENYVIYVHRKGLGGLTDKILSFALDADYYVSKYEMRHMFGSSDDLMKVCTSLLDKDTIHNNLIFDAKKNVYRENVKNIERCIEEDIDGLEQVILNAFGETYNGGIYLWGAGKKGIPLATYLKSRGVVIKGIIDNNLYGSNVNGLNICSLDEVKDGAKVFITILNKETNEAILEQINSSNKSIAVIRYQDLDEIKLHSLIK